MNTLEDRKWVGVKKDFSFSFVYLIGDRKVEEFKILYLIENKNKKIKNVVCINLILQPYYIENKNFKLF